MPDLTTLPRVKEWLQLDPDFQKDDKLLKRLISAMSTTFTTKTNREIITRSYTEILSGNDARIRVKSFTGPYLTWWRSGTLGYALELRDTPVTGITSVTVDGVTVPQATNLGQDTQTDGWVLEDGHRLILLGTTYSFTVGVSNVTLVYTAGYGTTAPADVEEAVIQMVAWQYKSRDRFGQVQKGDAVGNVTWSQKEFPDYVTSTIVNYSKVNV